MHLCYMRIRHAQEAAACTKDPRVICEIEMPCKVQQEQNALVLYTNMECPDQTTLTKKSFSFLRYIYKDSVSGQRKP